MKVELLADGLNRETGDQESGQQGTGRDSLRSRDLMYAILTMTFAIIVAGVLLYGSWWRRERSTQFYRAAFDDASADYQHLVESGNADENPDELFQIGSRVDLLMKRMNEKGIGSAMRWRHAEFLREHANRLDRFDTEESWDGPEQSEGVQLRIGKYRDRSRALTDEVRGSKSAFRYDAVNRQIEDSIVFSTPSRRKATEYFQTLCEMISSESTASHDANGDSVMSRQTQDRAVVLATWLCLDSAWESASDQSPLIPKRQSIDDAFNRLEEIRARVLSRESNEASDQWCLSFVDTAKLILRLQMVDESGSQSEFGQSELEDLSLYDQTVGLMSAPPASSHLTDRLPMAIALCVRSDWPKLREMFSDVQRQSSLGRLENDTLKRAVSRTIYRLTLAPNLAEIPIDDRYDLHSGIDLATELDSSSEETCSMLYTISVLRSNRRQGDIDPEIAKKFASVMERVLESPSQPAFLVTAAIAAGIDGEADRILQAAETGDMLRTQLPARVGLVGIWRFGVTSQTVPNINPSDQTAEATAWGATMGGLLGEQVSERSKADGYALLAMAAWQLRAGDGDLGWSNFVLAREKLGPSPMVGQIEQSFVAPRPAIH